MQRYESCFGPGEPALVARSAPPPRSRRQRTAYRAQMTAARANQRLRILDALTEVVGESGYLSARIGEIARRAGVSRATFYEIFESKERAFLAAYRMQAGAAVSCRARRRAR